MLVQFSVHLSFLLGLTFLVLKLAVPSLDLLKLYKEITVLLKLIRLPPIFFAL